MEWWVWLLIFAGWVVVKSIFGYFRHQHKYQADAEYRRVYDTTGDAETADFLTTHKKRVDEGRLTSRGTWPIEPTG